MVLRNCATTARPCRVAGSSREATPRKATRWRGATRAIRAKRASRRTGPGRGRPTGASSTTAPAPIPRASPGTRRNRSSNGTAANGSASTCRTIRPRAPSENVGPFIMNGEGMGRLFALDQMVEGPFPEHYEPFEIAVGERAASEGPQQSGRARLCRRPRQLRRPPPNSPMSEPPIASPSTSTSGPSMR